jgi:hypothetical protein
MNPAIRPGLFEKIHLVFAMTCAFLSCQVLANGNMRCGESVIERGFTFFEVLERCGEPDLEYAWDHNYVPSVQARVTEWVYEQGTNKFRRILTFEEGRLRTIELRPKPVQRIEASK